MMKRLTKVDSEKVDRAEKNRPPSFKGGLNHNWVSLWLQDELPWTIDHIQIHKYAIREN